MKIYLIRHGLTNLNKQGKVNGQIDELTEIQMGTLAGKSWEEMAGGLELKKKHRSGKFNYLSKGGESAKQVKDRLIKFLKKINGKHKDHEALIITHGGIIRMLHILADKPLVIDQAVAHISPFSLDLKKIGYK